MKTVKIAKLENKEYNDSAVVCIETLGNDRHVVTVIFDEDVCEQDWLNNAREEYKDVYNDSVKVIEELITDNGYSLVGNIKSIIQAYYN